MFYADLKNIYVIARRDEETNELTVSRFYIGADKKFQTEDVAEYLFAAQYDKLDSNPHLPWKGFVELHDYPVEVDANIYLGSPDSPYSDPPDVGDGPELLEPLQIWSATVGDELTSHVSGDSYQQLEVDYIDSCVSSAMAA